ncbi:unnamed protein product [Urochloa decumbens]|uniref:Uncharacterized protein n=1 Tax=Urochloa decumbens TaxID=240449 RepID=A0ABC8WYM3_9POAL
MPAFPTRQLNGRLADTALATSSTSQALPPQGYRPWSSSKGLATTARPRSMDVYISEEYVAQRRAERRAARNAAAAAAARCGEEKARADAEQKRWAAAAWAKEKRTVDGNASANPGGGAASWLVGEDAVLSYFSA